MPCAFHVAFTRCVISSHQYISFFLYKAYLLSYRTIYTATQNTMSHYRFSMSELVLMSDDYQIQNSAYFAQIMSSICFLCRNINSFV